MKYKIKIWDWTFGITSLILLIISLVLLWFLYKAYFPTPTQRIWPASVARKPGNKEFITLLADQMMDDNKLFLIRYPTTKNFPSIFATEAERNAVEKSARDYFKKQFGLSDTYLNTFMFEIRVSEESGYHANHVKNQPGKQYPLIDGGFTVFIPPGKRLYGRYGGKTGVSSSIKGILAYGYYILGDDYKIRYVSACPLQQLQTFDGNYNFIDCDVKIEDATDKGLVGLMGKAQGMYKNWKLDNGLNYISIRNVLTFW